MSPAKLDTRKTAARLVPPTWVPLRRRLYLPREVYEAAMERVRAREYPSLAAFIQFAVQEHLGELLRDERRAAGLRVLGADGPTERKNRRKAFLNRRADEIFAVYEKTTQPVRHDERPELLTSAATPGSDDDLFAISPLLTSDEKAALETIGDWIPDLFADGPHPDEKAAGMVSHAKPPLGLAAAEENRGDSVSHAKSLVGRSTALNAPPVRRRRTK